MPCSLKTPLSSVLRAAAPTTASSVALFSPFAGLPSTEMGGFAEWAKGCKGAGGGDRRASEGKGSHSRGRSHGAGGRHSDGTGGGSARRDSTPRGAGRAPAPRGGKIAQMGRRRGGEESGPQPQL